MSEILRSINPAMANLLLPAAPAAVRPLRQRREPAPYVDEEEERTIAGSMRDKSLSMIGAVGNLLDLPGSMVRDVGSSIVQGKFVNPFDQLLSPFSGDNRTTGKELLQQTGIIDDADTWGNAIAGFGAEVAADPLTYMTFGASALGKAGKVASKAGMMDDLGMVAARKAGKEIGQVGPREARLTTTLGDIAQYGTERSAAKAKQVLEDSPELANEVLGGLAGFGLPFMQPMAVAGQGAKSQAVARGLDTAGRAVRYGKIPGTEFQPVNSLLNLFDAPAMGAKSPMFQAIARHKSRQKDVKSADVLMDTNRWATELEQAGLVGQDAADMLRDGLEGVVPISSLPDAMQPIVRQMRAQSAEMPNRGRLEGAQITELTDDEIDYAARFLVATRGIHGKRSKAVFTADDPSNQGRKDFIRNAPGGTNKLKRELFLDDAINAAVDSGVDVDTIRKMMEAKANGWLPDTFKEFNPKAEGAVDGWVIKEGRYEKIAEWFGGLSKETREAGVFGNHPILDHTARRMAFEDSINATETVALALSQPKILLPPSAAANAAADGSMTVGEVLAKLKMDLGDVNGGLGRKIMKSQGMAPDDDAIKALRDMRLSKENAEELLSIHKTISGPDAINDLISMMDSVVNYSKGMWTSVWPAFHVRNRISGAFQNMALGIWSKEGDTWADQLLKGKVIEGAAKEPWVRAVWEREQAELARVNAATPPGGAAPGMGVSPTAGPGPIATPIDVGGAMRPRTDSTGAPIHTTEEGIKNFWESFGDSKVVDQEGRPLVVYHGTGNADLGTELQRQINTEARTVNAEIDNWNATYRELHDRLTKKLGSLEYGSPEYKKVLEERSQIPPNPGRIKGRVGKQRVREEREQPSFDTLRYGENDAGYLSAGTYFTSSPKMASDYAEAGSGGKRGVLPVYLNLKNPFIHGVTQDPRVDEMVAAAIDAKSGSMVDDWSRVAPQARREVLTDLGYDGEIYSRNQAAASGANRSDLAESEIVAFYPEQIKSATGNRGTFDTSDPSILATPIDRTPPRSLYRQADTTEALAAMDPDRHVYGDGPVGSQERYFTDNPELALGQGRNADGVLMEFADEFGARPQNTVGYAASAAMGRGGSFVAPVNPGEVSQYLRSATFPDEKSVPRYMMSQEWLDEAGFTMRKLGNGQVEFRKQEVLGLDGPGELASAAPRRGEVKSVSAALQQPQAIPNVGNKDINQWTKTEVDAVRDPKNFKKISPAHAKLNDHLDYLVAKKAIKPEDADIMRLIYAQTDARHLPKSVRAGRTLKTQEGRKVKGALGFAEAEQWHAEDRISLLSKAGKKARNQASAYEEGTRVMLHELAHIVYFAALRGGNAKELDAIREFHKLAGTSGKKAFAEEFMSGGNTAFQAQYHAGATKHKNNLANPEWEQFAEFFAHSVMRRKIPTGAIGTIINDAMAWLRSQLEKLAKVVGLDVKVRSRLDEIVDELGGFNNAPDITNLTGKSPAGQVPTANVPPSQIPSGQAPAGQPPVSPPQVPPIGQAVPSQPPRPAVLTDEEATRIIGRMAASQGVVGKFEGNATSIVGQPTGQSGDLMDTLSGIPRPGNQQISAGRVARKAAGREPGTSLNPFDVRGVGGREESGFGIAAAGEEIGNYIEGMNRLGPFITMMKRGYDPAEASKKVGAAQVLYGNKNYTPFEQQVMTRLFPFYKFSRGSMPVIARNLMEKPGGMYGTIIKGNNRAQSDGELAPDYVRDTANIPIDRNNPILSAIAGTPPEGTDRYLTGLGLMHEDLLGFGPSVRGAGLEAMSRMNPFVKGPIEWATGQTFFQRGPEGGRDLDKLDPTVGRFVANVMGQTGPDDSKKFPLWMEQIVANSPIARLTTTARSLTDPRKRSETVPGMPGAASLLNTLTGFRVSDVSPASKDAILREMLNSEMQDAGATVFERVYFSKEELAKMSPEARENAIKLQGLANVLAKRSKERKAEREAAAANK